MRDDEVKSYTSQQHIRLVGKAWEIRRYLNRMAQTSKTDVTLAEYLTGLLNYTETNRDKPIRVLNKR
jgi:hypothetical protein